MAKRVLCKFFAHGSCLKGEHCEFAHDWKAPQNNVCTFYQKGVCAYGSRCRYEHVKVSSSPSSVRSSSSGERPALSSAGATPDVAAQHSPSVGPSDQAMCSLAAVGDCPRGEKCPHVHGDVCPICGEQCLHPFRAHEREEHMETCEKRQKHLEKLRHSQEIECSVCLEHVLSKPTSTERKFGILSECDHPFCVTCIRSWRSSSPSSGINVNSALRACPICRRLSYFVIPSVVWYGSKEEKQDIIESYLARLRSIDCKHFDFGNGTCPFGTSCFYRHAYSDGRLEEVVLGHLGDEDGDTLIAKDIRISDFLSNMQIR